MADAIRYSHLDAGAPARNFGKVESNPGGSAGVVGWYNLLVACLVNGYGSGPTAKPGQGWEVIHAQLPKGFTLRSPDGVYYVFCIGGTNSYTYNGAARLYMAEVLSDPYVYPPVGTNVRSSHHSANYSASPSRHIFGMPYSTESVSSWYVVARGSQVYIYLNYGQSHQDGTGASAQAQESSYGGVFFLGNLILQDPGIPTSGVQNSVALGGAGSDYYGYESWNPSSEFYSSNLGPRGTRLRNPTTGMIETSGMPSMQGRPNLFNDYGAYKAGVDTWGPALVLERNPFHEGGVGFTGLMPGLFQSAYYSFRRMASITQALGRGVGIGDAEAPIEVGGEPFYMLPTFYGTAFMSLLEKYWV